MRPHILPKMRNLDRYLEVISALLLAVFVMTALYFFSQLPKQIPTHFNMAGEVDSYGPRASIFTFLLIATLIYTGLSLIVRYPWLFNYKVEITKENAEKEYATGQRMIRVVKLVVMVIFLLLHLDTINISINGSGKLGMVVPCIVGSLIIGMLSFAIFSNRTKKS